MNVELLLVHLFQIWLEYRNLLFKFPWLVWIREKPVYQNTSHFVSFIPLSIKIPKKVKKFPPQTLTSLNSFSVLNELDSILWLLGLKVGD